MIFYALFRALKSLLSAPLRSLVLRSFLITLLTLIGLALGFRMAFLAYIWPFVQNNFPQIPAYIGWTGALLIVSFTLGFAFMVLFFLAPFTSFVGSFFVDEAMRRIEEKEYAADGIGKPMGIKRAIEFGFAYLFMSLIANALALFSLFLPHIHLFIFYGANAYLLGRQYFTFAAERFLNKKQCLELYKAQRLTIFLAGLMVTVFISIPFLNLASPIFASALMTHLYKTLVHKDGSSGKSAAVTHTKMLQTL